MTETATPYHEEGLALDAVLSCELDELRRRGLLRHIGRACSRVGALVNTGGGFLVDFASNDYLGLASDERPAVAAMRAIIEHSAGAAASRLIVGTNPEHDALERELAEFFDTESALSFSSGYAANVGIIGALVGRGDAVFSDALNHASLIDGARVSRSSIYVYPHRDVAALERLLAVHRRAHRRALIVTDGMFSMDGDVAPLADLVDLARRYGAWTYVDDAHAVGAVGPEGRGTTAVQGAAARPDVLVGTLGKAFGVAGAFVVGSATLQAYLVNRARSFVFSTAPMPAQAAAAREGLRIARAEPDRRMRLAENAARLRASLASLGVSCAGDATSHIVPVIVGGAARAAALGPMIVERGFAVGAVRPPTVPPGTSRLRLSVSAAHTSEQIAGVAQALADSLAACPT
ncbi:MAG TPA: 8-amino-7-oxononanoate synthase [Gemmatimonadaceae bacterium]|nr:8-amino-7-oxononanoate synthase [Gemmatimonadaceae bacterium]